MNPIAETQCRIAFYRKSSARGSILALSDGYDLLQIDWNHSATKSALFHYRRLANPLTSQLS